MSEITLSDLIKTSSAAAEVPSETTPEEISAQISVLTPEERRQADEIREQIDVRDSQMVMQFGAGARQNIADFSENILKNIRAKDSGYVGALMTDLVTNVEKLDFDSLEKGNGILGLFQKLEAKVKRFLAQYEKLELQVGRIEGKLEEARMEMLKDIGILDSLYEKNLNYFRQLQVYITAGQEKLDEQRERIIREANEKANAILREAKEVADETIRSFHKFGKENISAAEMEKERERLRKKIKDTAPSAAPRKAKKAHRPEEFKLGETVKVLSMNLTGTVQSLPDSRGNITVQMGILRSQVNISDLEIVDEPSPYTPKKMSRTSKGRIGMSKSLSVSPEINLLGKTVDEAVAELDKYLDDALLSHLNTVRVVHGKGTGALRKGIHEYLRRQKHVKSYHLAEFGEGDAGVTIVELK